MTLKNYAFVFVLSSLLLSCSNSKFSGINTDELILSCEYWERHEDILFTQDCKPNWNCEYTLIRNAQVDFSSEIPVRPGINLVLHGKFEHTLVGHEEIIDVWLEIPNNPFPEFEKFGDVNVGVKFDYRDKILEPNSGCVEAVKLEDGSWKVKLFFDYGDLYDIFLPFGFEATFSD